MPNSTAEAIEPHSIYFNTVEKEHIRILCWKRKKNLSIRPLTPATEKKSEVTEGKCCAEVSCPSTPLG